MARRPPLWRQVFDAADRRVSGPVEAGANSALFGDLLAIGLRVQGRARRELEHATARALHLVNLPAASDVRRLSEQLAALRRELRELEDELEETPPRP